MLQMARNLSDAEDGFLRRKKFLMMDREAKFSEEFRATLEQVGIEAVRLPPRSPKGCLIGPELLRPGTTQRATNKRRRISSFASLTFKNHRWRRHRMLMSTVAQHTLIDRPRGGGRRRS